MKFIFIISSWLMLSIANGQSFDSIISSNRYIDCRDISYNAFPIVDQLYSNHKIDSIYQFIDYWETNCGPVEPAFRLKNILKIKTKTFNSNSMDPSWIELLVSYRRSLKHKDFNSFYYRYSPYISFDLKKFNNLTQRIANSTSSNNLDESLLIEFYGNESPTFEKIKAASNNSKLNQFHNEIYNKTLWKPELHIALATGISSNFGNISIFGTRPNFGIVMGGKQLRHNYDFILDFRAGPSKEKYSFIYKDSLISENKWTGMYVGFEYTFDFIYSNKIDFGISPGIGYDRITALTLDNDFGEDAKFLSSFNKNIGLVLKYKYGKNGGYMGLHFRYNLANYHNPGGTELDGEYLNIRFTIGSIFDYWRASKLKDLE